jgi:lipoate---protein ligase
MASTYALDAIDVIDGGVECAKVHMALDSFLVGKLPELRRPLLHLFQWKRPTITYGHFISLEEHLYMKSSEFDFARRPTGGGILFHFDDFSFSFAVPASSYCPQTIEESYSFLNAPVLQVLFDNFLEPSSLLCERTKDKNFCMANPTRFDLIWNGYKVGGCAQRRTSFGLLHQFSCFLGEIPWDKVLPLLKGEKIEAMRGYSFPLSPKDRKYTSSKFSQDILSAFNSLFSR